MQLARFDITTVSKLKQIVQQECCYDNTWSDCPRSRSTQNTLNKKQYSPNYNNASNNHNRNQYYNQNRNQYNNSHDQSFERLFQEFKQKLDQAQAQNPVNYQHNPVSSTAPNQGIKSQRASTRGHSKMDTSESFHLHASDEEEHTIPS